MVVNSKQKWYFDIPDNERSMIASSLGKYEVKKIGSSNTQAEIFFEPSGDTVVVYPPGSDIEVIKGNNGTVNIYEEDNQLYVENRTGSQLKIITSRVQLREVS